jgi:hypothetical protein
MTRNIIATMSQVKRQLMNDPQSRSLVGDDSLIQTYCQFISDMLEERTGNKYFVPRRETRYYSDNDVIFPCDVSFTRYDGEVLSLDKEIVEVFSLTTNNGNTAIDSSNFFLRTSRGYNNKPYTKIELDRNIRFDYTDFQKAHAVDGLWVNHNDPDNMWKYKTGVLNNPLAVDGLIVSVTDASIFNIQELIRFGDDNTGEFAFIELVDVDNNNLVIERGVNGTTAAEQSQGTNIYVFKPRYDAILAAQDFTAFLYKNRQNAGGSSDRVMISPSGEMLVPLAMLPDTVRVFVNRYSKKI